MSTEFTPPPVAELCDALVRSMAESLKAIATPVHLVGIHTGGVWVAESLHARLGFQSPPGTLDVSFYRDDYAKKGLHANVHGKKASHIPFDVTDAHIILVDDVFHTGRTMRAALNELFDYGRPRRVELAVLVDRGMRELPIVPTYCAHSVSLPKNSRLSLQKSVDGELGFRLDMQ